MPISMLALKTFSGRSGEGHRAEHLIEDGDQFDVADPRRADYLEGKGLAAKIFDKAAARPLNKMEPAPKNKAAATGPLDSVGGTTGAAEPVPSSHQDRPQRGRRLARSKDEDLL